MGIPRFFNPDHSYMPPPRIQLSSNGSLWEKNLAIYEEYFPFADGATKDTRLPSPVDADGHEINLQELDLADLTLDFFMGLHSSHQLELLHRAGGSLTLSDGNQRIDVLVGADGRTVLILQNLSKSDIAGLSSEDEQLVAKYATDLPDDVKAGLEATWGVTLSGTLDQIRSTATDMIAEALANIAAKTSEYAQSYVDQLDLLQTSVENSDLISLSNLKLEIDAIVERFTRMFAFEKALKDVAANPPPLGHPPVAISLDGNATLEAGLQSFIEQEQRILDAKNQRSELERTSSALDLPSRVSALQLIDNIIKEAETAILVTELEQMNALLRDYAEFARLVGEATKAGAATDDIVNILGGTDETTYIVFVDESVEVEVSNSVKVSNKVIAALMMFGDYQSDEYEYNIAHPLESLYSITRPTQELVHEANRAVLIEIDPPGESYRAHYANLRRPTDTQWNILSTQISEAVTLVNQQGQILTNDISSFNQETNRHFELANSSLKRMMDMINAIARI